MSRYEYKVVPAPKKAGKIRGVKGTDNRFAAALTTVMNDMGADGWEYQRTDTLPCEERKGLTGTTTTFQNMLVFRRAFLVEEEAPIALIEHEESAPEEPVVEPEPVETQPEPQRYEIAEEPENREPTTMAAPTFSSASVSSAPKITAHMEPAEGSAPPVRSTNPDAAPQ